MYHSNVLTPNNNSPLKDFYLVSMISKQQYFKSLSAVYNAKSFEKQNLVPHKFIINTIRML